MMAAGMMSREMLRLRTSGDEKRPIKLSVILAPKGEVTLRPTSKYTSVHPTEDMTHVPTECPREEGKSEGLTKYGTTRWWIDEMAPGSSRMEEISIGGGLSNNVCPSDNCRENSELCTSVSVLSRY